MLFAFFSCAVAMALCNWKFKSISLVVENADNVSLTALHFPTVLELFFTFAFTGCIQLAGLRNLTFRYKGLQTVICYLC